MVEITSCDNLIREVEPTGAVPLILDIYPQTYPLISITRIVRSNPGRLPCVFIYDPPSVVHIIGVSVDDAPHCHACGNLHKTFPNRSANDKYHLTKYDAIIFCRYVYSRRSRGLTDKQSSIPRHHDSVPAWKQPNLLPGVVRAWIQQIAHRSLWVKRQHN